VPPAAEPAGDGLIPPSPPVLNIPEIRDYQRINAELRALLEAGHRRVRLEGAEGQRLLVSALAGDWEATVEIEGRTGPELAADLEAPGLLVVARGDTADGAGRGLRAGRLLILGDAGDAPGAGQAGGLIVVTGAAGHRSGLGQSGGTLALLGPVGRLAGDRQSGGRIFARRDQLGPHSGRGRRGGSLIELPVDGPIDPEDAMAWGEVVAAISPWSDPASLPSP